jgi:DNA-binding protein HU-beta
MMMTQTQTIQALADKTEMTKKVAKTMMEKLGQTAVSEVKKNGLFVLPGIGRLVKIDRKARMGRNPATGEAIKIAAKKGCEVQNRQSCQGCNRAAEGEEVTAEVSCWPRYRWRLRLLNATTTPLLSGPVVGDLRSNSRSDHFFISQAPTRCSLLL